MTFSQYYDRLLVNKVNPRSKEAYIHYPGTCTWQSWLRMVYKEEKIRQVQTSSKIVPVAESKPMPPEHGLDKDTLLTILEQETLTRNRRLTNQDLFEIGQPYKLSVLELSRIIDPHNGSTLSATIDSIYKLHGLSVKDKVKVAELEAKIKILQSENKTLVEQRLKHSDIVTLITSAIDSFTPIPIHPTTTNWIDSRDNPVTDAVLLLSDFHWEERVHRDEVVGVNEYSLEVAQSRIDSVFEKVYTRFNQLAAMPPLTICLLGDMINGLINEGATDRRTGSITAAVTLSDYLAQKIHDMSQYTPITVKAVCGNHGRTKPEVFYKQYAEENWDTVMYLLMQRRLEQSVPDFEIGMAPYLLFNLQNTQRVMMSHGHLFKGGSGFNSTPNTLSRDMAKLADLVRDDPFDYLVIGHFHSEGEVRAFGGRQMAFLNGSLIGGTPYSIATVKKADIPSQTLLLFDEDGLHSKHVLTVR